MMFATVAPSQPHLGLGWRPDHPDMRDFRFQATLPPEKLPAMVDLSAALPPVLDQGALGSCTANAIAACVDYERNLAGLKPIGPSRLMLYFLERVFENTIPYDAGASLRDGMKATNVYGVAPETLWPYDVSRFAQQPPPAAFAEAKNHVITQYLRVGLTLTEMQSCLAAGHPFVIGVTVYQSFVSPQTAQTGDIPMPDPSEAVEGGHAILIYGYDNATGRFKGQNSWGVAWGQQGRFVIPYGYLTNPGLAGDCWTIRAIAEHNQPNPRPPAPSPQPWLPWPPQPWPFRRS